nr:traB domain-containing protein isoform X4 [Ipomoea trifida]
MLTLAGGSCGDNDCISFSSSIEGRDCGGRSCSGLTAAWNSGRSCGSGGVVAAQVLRLSLLRSRPADCGRGGRRSCGDQRRRGAAVFLPSPKDLNRMVKEMDDVDMLTLVI